MNELRDHVIAAHGGLDRWSELTSVEAHLINGGVLWAMKKQAGVIDDVNGARESWIEYCSRPFSPPNRCVRGSDPRRRGD